MKIRKFIILLLPFLFYSNISLGQDRLSYGIKAGLNFSTIKGENEKDNLGAELEGSGYLTGFHIGVIFDVWLLEDQFGIAPELLFSQKGGKYNYDGSGFLPLSTSNGILETEGIRKVFLSKVNSYLDIPIMIYYKPVDRLKLSAGINVGFMIASGGNGETQFFWRDTDGNNQNLLMELDYNYFRDKPGEASTEETEVIIVDGSSTTIEYPTSIGAYYFDMEKKGNVHNIMDLGLNADVTFFLTKGISLGGRVNYGLLDVSNDDLDFSMQNPSSNRSDKDKNLSFQVSLAFNF